METVDTSGIGAENSSIVNVSRWESVESAKQVATFRPMLDLAEYFAQLGVRFERPILNFTSVWTIVADH